MDVIISVNDAVRDTVFISGLPDDITEDQLASHFGSLGLIKIEKKSEYGYQDKLKICIYRDKNTGKCNGEATVTYEEQHSAKTAITWFNGKEFPNSGKTIKVEFARRKSGGSGMDGGFGGDREGPVDPPSADSGGHQ